MNKPKTKSMIALRMKRSKKTAFIGIFPSRYRAEVAASNLEWSGYWKPVYDKVEFDENACRVMEQVAEYE